MTNKTLIVTLLDESGSMQSIKNDMITAFNDFIIEQRKINGNDQDTRVSLFTFRSGYDNTNAPPWIGRTLNRDMMVFNTIYENRSVDGNVCLDNENFRPNGGTPLYDAVCKTIDLVTRNALEYSKVIFIIISDGQENTSKEFSALDVKNRIQNKQERNNWQFLYFGANQDVSQEGNKLGLRYDQVYQYTANKLGVNSMSFAASKSVSDYTRGIKVSCCIDDKDRMATN